MTNEANLTGSPAAKLAAKPRPRDSPETVARRRQHHPRGNGQRAPPPRGRIVRDEIYVRPFAGSIEFEVPLEAPTVCTKFRPKAAYFRDGGPTAANSTTSDRRDFSIARSPKARVGRRLRFG
jgi:hypothetical protein